MKKSYFSFVVLFAVIIVFTNCRGGGNKKLMPELFAADSAAVMFYHTPGNPRFFNLTKVPELSHLEPVINDANSKVIAKREDCATQGKIYFYGKNGAVSVLYFSDMQECMTVSFIIAGEKYYTRLSSESRKVLDDLKKMATEPVAADPG